MCFLANSCPAPCKARTPLIIMDPMPAQSLADGRLTGAFQARCPGRLPVHLSCKLCPWYPCGAAPRPLALRVGLRGQADGELREASRPRPSWSPALALGRSAKPDRPNNGRKAMEVSDTRLMHLCCFSSARARRAG